MKKRNLIIIYAKSTQEIFNRKSALGSYIHCLAKLLENDFNIFLNGIEINAIGTPNQQEKLQANRSKLSLLKKLIPRFLKLRINEKKLIGNIQNLKESILAAPVKFDEILEFYTLGSDIGLELQNKLSIKSTIIYDGPIFEEYCFFQGRKPIHEKHFLTKEKKSLDKATNVVVYSQPMSDFLQEKYKLNSEKISIHQNIDFSRFELGKEKTEYKELNICFIGSFLKWHRVDLLIDAFEFLVEQKKYNQLRLYLIGDGMLKKSIEEKTMLKSISKHIRFTGFKDGKELLQLKEKMHIGVMPSSNWYGAPNKLFEYGAMKMACIAPRTKTIDYLFNEKEVEFFKNGDLETLKKALENLVADPIELRSKSNAIYEKITSTYNKENTYSFYTKLLRP